MDKPLLLCLEDELADYSFPDNHPFGRERLFAFRDHLKAQVDENDYELMRCHTATAEQLMIFHDPAHIEEVRQKSIRGCGFLDKSDTPACQGIFEAACRVVGTVLDAADRIMQLEAQRVFVPIAGLHHARRKSCAGFCVFNDIGVAIEHLRSHHGLQRIAYIDIDAHHGDGVFYEYQADPDLLIVDFHEDGHFIYPGTGHTHERGTGAAKGTKMNLPLPMYADDEEFLELWPAAEQFIDRFEPEFILLQCGADSMKGDPVTDMALTTEPYAHVSQCLRALADRHCKGKLLAMGGGGYNLHNVASAWVEVVKQLI